MSYLYDDEDNQPMMDEHMPVRDIDRDCPNCRFKMPSGQCTKWTCDFAPKDYVIEEVQEWLEKERTRQESLAK